MTTAAALAEAGWSVAIVARETHEDTVSSVAAAGWSGTESEPADKARRWALASRERFERIAEDPSAGVRPLHQRELHRADPGPSWWERTPYVRRLEADEVPEGYAAGFAVLPGVRRHGCWRHDWRHCRNFEWPWAAEITANHRVATRRGALGDAPGDAPLT